METDIFITKSRDTFFKLGRLDRYMTGHKGFIAGGVFKDLFTGNKFRDVDIFFKSEADFWEADTYYKNNPTSWSFVYENQNARCYMNTETKVKVELVRAEFGPVWETLNRFDFTVVKFAYFKDTDGENTEYKAMYHKYFFEDLVNKKLVIDNTSSFPINTLERTWKYKGYGFGLCRESKIKVVEMLKDANPEDIGNSLYFGFD